MAMVCLMAAVNVAVTKTPISTSIILSVLSGTAMLPVIAISSFVSFLLTSELSMLKTQRSRDLDELYVTQKLRQQVNLSSVISQN